MVGNKCTIWRYQNGKVSVVVEDEGRTLLTSTTTETFPFWVPPNCPLVTNQTHQILNVSQIQRRIILLLYFIVYKNIGFLNVSKYELNQSWCLQKHRVPKCIQIRTWPELVHLLLHLPFCRLNHHHPMMVEQQPMSLFEDPQTKPPLFLYPIIIPSLCLRSFVIAPLIPPQT